MVLIMADISAIGPKELTVLYHDSALSCDIIIMPRVEAYGSSFVCLSLCRGRSYGGILLGMSGLCSNFSPLFF